MIINAESNVREEVREDLMPVRVVESKNVENVDELMLKHADWVSFWSENKWTVFKKNGYVILDFGKELCGGIRMINQNSDGMAKFRLTFGESLTEACSSIGEKNATNDHSPRDFEVISSPVSDLSFGQTGFRFVRIELLECNYAFVQNIWAVSYLPKFDREAKIVTDDELLNRIIETAAYTLKLTFQKGYIWDGIKRDRLVWSGDLHSEIITSLYLAGDNDNIKNSLIVLKSSVEATGWINKIPTYSAWWVINLCDYSKKTGNMDFFKENRDYAMTVIKHFNDCIKEDKELVLTNGYDGMEYFLDWSTLQKQDAKVGVASLICFMANKFMEIEENEDCKDILRKLSYILDVQTTLKPVRAFQVLAGRNKPEDDKDMLQKNGAEGFSTFMAYYILTAMAKSGGTDMLKILKTYYGGMLSRGATSFWEDFDMSWLENSGCIDEYPKEGQKDIHGDFGKYCYTKFRHSLCHGWSSGVLAFIVEYILGVHIEDGGRVVRVNPHTSGLKKINASIPLNNGMLKINIEDGKLDVKAPEETEITVETP